MASGCARDWKWGSRGGVCSHRGVMRTDSIYDVWCTRLSKILDWGITPFILELNGAVREQKRIES